MNTTVEYLLIILQALLLCLQFYYMFIRDDDIKWIIAFWLNQVIMIIVINF